MNKQIFALTQNQPAIEISGDGKTYRALETHTVSSLSARLGVPKSTAHRWLQNETIPAQRLFNGSHRISSSILNELALRLKAETVKKRIQVEEQTRLSALLQEPAAASTDDLMDGYMQAKDPATRGQIWSEVSKRYRQNPHATAKTIAEATKRNSERIFKEPRWVNTYDKTLNKTVRTLVP
jgi:hypothetical protein